MTPWATLLILAVFATGMAVVSAVSVRWTAFAHTHSRAGLVQFLLLMMAGMLAGILVYFARGGLSGAVAGLWTATVIMSASVFLLFIGFFRDFRAADGPAESARHGLRRGPFTTSVIGLVIANEFLMGWSFSLLAGSLPAGPNAFAAHPAGILTGAITSPWFVFPMALEMALTVRWLYPQFPPLMRRFLVLQPAIMVCSPPTLAPVAWQVSTAVGSSALMAGAVAVLFVAVYRDEPMPRTVTTYGLGLLGSLGAMAAGLFLWVETGSASLFAVSLLAQMIVFLYAVSEPTRYGALGAPAPDVSSHEPVSRPTESSQ